MPTSFAPRRLAAVAAVVVAGLVLGVHALPLFGMTPVVTSGVSMQPEFHTGDLAVVGRASTYRAGDIVAYRSSTLRTVVLHRITAVDGAGRYTFKGDNNSWFDPDQPGRDELVGRLALHVRRGGTAMAFLAGRSGVGLLVLVSLAALPAPLRRRLPRRSHRRRQRSGSAMNHRRTSPDVLASARRALHRHRSSFGLAAAVLVAATAFTAMQPATRHVDRPLPFREQASFAYHAAVDSPAVYPDGSIDTGEPVFLRVSSDVQVDVRYHLEAPALRAASGTVTLAADVSGTNGWHRRFELGSAPLAGADATVSAPLQLPSIRAALSDAEAATGIRANTYHLTLTASVAGAARAGATAIDLAWSPSYALDLGAGTLTPAGKPEVSRDGSATRRVTAPATIRFGGRAVDVRAARTGAAGAAGLALVLLVASLALGAPSSRQATRAVPIVAMAAADGRAILDLPSLEDLTALAERLDGVVLQDCSVEPNAYLVQLDRTVYRYRPAA
jgi:signal peptidase I